MTNRTEYLRNYLTNDFGDAVIFTVDPPNNAGLYFAQYDGWKVLAHIEQLTEMAQALSDEHFVLFVHALAELCRQVLALVEDEDTLDQTILDAQFLVAEILPDSYTILDSVFFVED